MLQDSHDRITRQHLGDGQTRAKRGEMHREYLEVRIEHALYQPQLPNAVCTVTLSPAHPLEAAVEPYEKQWRRRQQDELNAETLSSSRYNPNQRNPPRFQTHSLSFRAALVDRYRSLRASLLHDNAVWGSPSESEEGFDAAQWTLDPTEGPCRQRKRHQLMEAKLDLTLRIHAQC